MRVDLKIGVGMHVILTTSSRSTHDGRGSRGTNGSSGDWVVTYGTVTSTPRTLNNKPAVRSEDSWRNFLSDLPDPPLLSSLSSGSFQGKRYSLSFLVAAISPLHTFSSDPHPLRQHDLIMSSQDLHQVILRWPYTDANEVSWKTSLHLTRKPDGFEAPPIYVPWRNKFAYKFVVDGRWPVLPEPEPSTAPPSYHSESEVEHEPAEKVADKPTTNGTILHVVRDTPTPTADAAPEQHPRVPDVESDVTVDPASEAVAPAPIKVEKAADEITSESEAPKDSPAPAPSEVYSRPELAPNVPIGILPNSTPGSPSQDSTPTTRVDFEREIATHVPLRFGSEDVTPAPVKEEEAPEETTPALVEEEEEPEEATTAPVEEGEPEETTPAPVEEDGEQEETTLAPVEEPEETTPALVEEEPTTLEGTEVSTSRNQNPRRPKGPKRLLPPASQEPATVPGTPSEPAPKPEPVPEAKAEVAAVQVPAPEATPVAEPAPVVEATPTKAPVAAPEPTPQVAPAVNGHSKTLSGPALGRKTSRKFSFPGHGKDKSGNSSPTGSSRFASQQKREKRHSLLHKLKEIFSDKGKKKSEAKA
ncbi:hypothetical protein EDB86DRAFT_3085813 [Lactarius hatsudake]|nr:hypothetical protein EDB86DRAFT_3085813 [Lactarius hatsudake]